MSRTFRTIGLHLLGWLLFFGLLVGFVDSLPEDRGFSQIWEPGFLAFFFLYVFLFYLNGAVLIPKLYLQQKALLYYGITLALFAFIFWLKPYETFVLRHLHRLGEGGPPRFEERPPFGSRPPSHFRRLPPGGRLFDITSIVLFLGVWAVSMALQLFRQWRQTERRALQAESDKVNAELSFLKAQINPHFLFNTLNNIYSLSVTKSEQTPNAILKLSEILHYITDDVRDDFVPLQSEVDCAKNYIELQRLRLTDKVDVQFTVEGNLSGKEIAPLLFMTFIENAFKYGISSHEPCTIAIQIVTHEQSISFFCRNKILVKNATEERTGVGIGNAKKRLDHLYPGRYSLNVHTEGEVFSVHLDIAT